MDPRQKHSGVTKCYRKLIKQCTNYAELKNKLHESPNTIKNWREYLVKNKVVKVFKGSASMSFIFLPPYDSLVTCEQDDWAGIKIKSDPQIKKILDRVSKHDNMSLLPLIVELYTKLEKLEKKTNSM